MGRYWPGTGPVPPKIHCSFYSGCILAVHWLHTGKSIGPVPAQHWPSTVQLYWHFTGSVPLCTGFVMGQHWASTGPGCIPFWASTGPGCILFWAGTVQIGFPDTGPVLGPVQANNRLRNGPVLAQYRPSTTKNALQFYSGCILAVHWLHTGKSIGPVPAQHWPSTVQLYWHFTGSVPLCTGFVMGQHWASTGPGCILFWAGTGPMFWASTVQIGFPTLAQYRPSTVMFAGM